MSIDKAGVYDFKIRKGDTLRKPFNWTFPVGGPTDISAWDGELSAIDCDNDTSVLSLTTAGGGVLMSTLTTTIFMSAVETAALTWTRARFIHKLIDTPGTGDECTYIIGIICVIEENP